MDDGDRNAMVIGVGLGGAGVGGAVGAWFLWCLGGGDNQAALVGLTLGLVPGLVAGLLLGSVLWAVSGGSLASLHDDEAR